MNKAKHIIDRFGGVRPMVKKIKEATGREFAASTVQYWLQIGYVPIRQHEDILKAAHHHGIVVTRDELLPPDPSPDPLLRAAQARTGTEG